MPKILNIIVILMLLVMGAKNGVEARTPLKPTVTAVLASATATLVPTVTENKENITETSSKETIYRLESALEKQKVGGWNGINTGKMVVRWAVERGVAANTIVLLLLLPLVATAVSVLHYVLGLSGYGIFMPSMIAVTFLATGILGGLLLFALILMVSIASNLILKKYRLHFWPARSINLLFISLGTFGLMVGSTYVKIFDISKISIFPVLFMILLSEEFVRTQLVKSRGEAKRLTIGTLVLAIIGAAVMNVRQVEEWVLLNPEIVVMLVVVVNIVVGNYGGIRLTEIKRFKKAIRKPLK